MPVRRPCNSRYSLRRCHRRLVEYHCYRRRPAVDRGRRPHPRTRTYYRSPFYNVFMPPFRRDFLKSAFLAAAAQNLPVRAATSKLGIPGPYPGRVVEVHHPRSIVSGAYQAEPVKAMMQKGMLELTGAPSWTDAWKVFLE